MSHSIQIGTPSGHALKFVTMTIINYVVGGEPVSALADLGVTAIDGVILGTVPQGQNSLGVVLFPVLTGGKIMLFRFVSGTPTEITATTALNAVIPAIVHVVEV